MSEDRPRREGARPVITSLGVAAYAATLHAAYAIHIAPRFSYLGERYRAPDLALYGLSIGMVMLLALLLPPTIQRASQFVLWTLYVFCVAPTILVAQYADVLNPADAFVMSISVAAAFSALIVLTQMPGLRSPLRFRIAQTGVVLLLSTMSTAFYGYLAMTAGIHISLAGLGDVQDLRIQYRVLLASGGLFGYWIQLQMAVVNPLILAYGLVRRRIAPVAAGVVGQLIIFSITGYKLTLLSPLAIIAVIGYMRPRVVPRGRALVYGAIGASMLAVLLDWFLRGYLYTSIFVNRLILWPGVLTSAYVQVFAPIDKAKWAYSFMSPFISYELPATPGYLVGHAFSGSEITQANANPFADGYANLGYAGMFIEVAFLAIVLILLDRSSTHLPIRVVSAVLLVPSMGLVNNSAFTSLFTGGFAGAALILAALPKGGWTRRGTVSNLAKASSLTKSSQLAKIRARGSRKPLR